jgi:hypothetical protein
MPYAYKKIICFVLSALVILSAPVYSLGQTGMESKENRPSDWAETEIYAAIEDGLVPEGLQAHYQENITRSQYVLLALRVFELSGKDLINSEAEPFSDSLNHNLKADITRAYNAGIIKGDGKGHFFPDNEITREEISSLIVNLLMQITPERNFNPKQDYEYADAIEISDWAKNYINYCFENQILNGTGKNEQGLAKMAPKGKATIEQSIALLYRLSKRKGFISKSYYGEINLSPDNEEVESGVIEKFVSTFGESTFNIMKELSLNENIEVRDMRGESITMKISGTNTINLDQKKFEKNLFGLFFDINDEVSINVYRQLMKTFEESEEGIKLFEEYLPQLKKGEPLEIYDEINEDYIFVIKSSVDDSSIVYSISYVEPN